MTRGDDVIERYFDILLDGSTRKHLKASNVYVSNGGDVVYSYGSHFELIRALRDKKGTITGFLLNGDNYSVTTSRHQQWARGATMRNCQKHGLDYVIVPYSALNAADIDLGSIQLVEATSDTYETKTEEHFVLPPNAVPKWEPVTERVHLDVPELFAKVDEHNAEKLEDWTHRQKWIQEGLARDGKVPGWLRRDWLRKAPAPLTVGEWLAEMHRAGRLGNRYCGEDVTTKNTVTHHKLHIYTDSRERREWNLEYLPDRRSRYWRTHTRHWLGESLIRAQVRTTVLRKCRACRGAPMQGPRQQYVTQERDWDSTNWGAYREVTREYDIEHACQRCGGRGQYWASVRRWAYFLSGFDRNETRRSYFFCELPRGVHPTTVEEAYEALKPEPVRIAEEQGREVRRQGDIFAIPLTVTTRELTRTGAFRKKGEFILGTNHRATEVVVLDGVTYVRGTLTHDPGRWRRPDHHRVTLGRQWHLAVKNTVPLAVA